MTSEESAEGWELPAQKLGPLPLRVVLVGTEYAGNLGSVARVMRNMGTDDLVLVRPKANPSDAQALRMAVHAGEILDKARVVGTLSEALADCSEAAAHSADKKRLPPRYYSRAALGRGAEGRQEGGVGLWP